MRPHPETFGEIADAFERNGARFGAQLATLDDAGWSAPAKFLMGGKVVLEAPVGDHLWWVLFDAIHHRGQLSAYARPMGGKVPAIYGPSADES
jgi:uncharacterized damage-inducible protein DinB